MSSLSERKSWRTHGLIAAPFTPFQGDGSVDLERVQVLADTLCVDGVSGAFVCGSNGEGASMTIAERKSVAAEWVKASKGRLRILVHVGHSSIAEARDLMRHAREIGADAASASVYFRPSSVANLVACMAQIAAAAPDLPFYYYHIPMLTGALLDMVQFLEIATNQIPSLVGIKYTASTLWEYQSCLAVNDGAFDLLFGLDEMLLPAMSIGATGAIGSTYNFAAPLYLEVMRLFTVGNMAGARRVMGHLVQMVRIMSQYPPIPAQKAIMGQLGLSIGPSRLPLVELTGNQKAALRDQLNEMDFWTLLQSARSAASDAAR